MSEWDGMFAEPAAVEKAAPTFLFSGTRPAVYVTLSAADLSFADALGEARQRRAEEGHRQNLRVSQRMSDVALHRLGARGEVAVARHYGVALPPLDLGAISGDVNGVEVKTCPKRDGRLLVWKAKPGASHRPVVQVVEEGQRFRISGWMWTYEIRVAEFWETELPRPCWAVPQNRLHDPATLPMKGRS